MNRILKKTLLIMMTLGLILIDGLSSNTYATQLTEKDYIVTEDENVLIKATLLENDSNLFWDFSYNKDYHNENSLTVRVTDSKESILSLEQHPDWILNDNGWYVEKPGVESKGTFTVLTDKDTEVINIEIAVIEIQGDENIFIEEAKKYEVLKDDIINEESTKMEDEELPFEESIDGDGNTIITVDDPSKLEEVADYIKQVSNVRTVSYQDPFSYLDNENGKYPEHQSNKYLNGVDLSNTTKNYDYGKVSDSDNVNHNNVIGDELNFDTGYHEYSESEETGLLTKKTVKPTDKFNEFDVEVDIIGGAINVDPKIDVVLIIDKSGSMAFDVDGNSIPFWSNKKSRWKLLQESVDIFAEEILVDKKEDGTPRYDTRVGMTSFGSTGTTTPWTELAQFGTSGSPRFYTESADRPGTLAGHGIIDTSAPSNSGTPTFLGIESGFYVMNQIKRDDSKKFIVLITDGVSTFGPSTSFKGLDNVTPTDSGSFSSGSTGKNTKIKKYSLNSSFIGTGVENGLITEITDNTINRYNKLKTSSAGVSYEIKDYEIDYISLGITNLSSGNRYTQMNKLLTDFASKDQFFYGRTEAQVIEAFDVIKRIVSGEIGYFVNGYLFDPMSEYVDLISQTIETSALEVVYDHRLNKFSSVNVVPVTDKNGILNTTAPKYAQDVVVDQSLVSGNQYINLSKVTLGLEDNNRLGFRLNYRVKLKDNYIDGRFYPTNADTYAYADGYESGVGFAVPSVRVPKTSLRFKKVGLGKPLSGVTFELQKPNGEVETIVTDDSGEVEFNELHHGSYRLIEKSAPLGYELIDPIDFTVVQGPPVHNGVLSIKGFDHLKVDDEIIIVNKLRDFIMKVTKEDQYNNPLENVMFKLENITDENNIKVIDTDKEGNIFTFSGLEPGKYKLTETEAPNEYIKITVDLTINDDGSYTIDNNHGFAELTDNGNFINYTAVNVKKGILPSTGSSKMIFFIVVPAVLLLSGMFLGLSSIIRKTRKRGVIK